MRKTNPWSKFFLSNLYPYQGEVGNAFWGYHIANDVGRLLNIDGTVFVGPFDWSLYQNGQMAYRQFDIPTDSFQFSAAPVIQVWAYSDSGAQSIVTTTVDPKMAKMTNLRLETDMPVDTSVLSLWVPSIENDLNDVNLSGKLISIAQSFEVAPVDPVIYTEKMLVTDVVRYKRALSGIPAVYYTLTVNRGEMDSTPQYYYQNERMVLMDGAFTTRVTYSSNPLYEYWPPYVEAFLDSNKLRIRWLLDGGGTIYFKIFGA